MGTVIHGDTMTHKDITIHGDTITGDIATHGDAGHGSDTSRSVEMGTPGCGDTGTWGKCRTMVAWVGDMGQAQGQGHSGGNMVTTKDGVTTCVTRPQPLPMSLSPPSVSLSLLHLSAAPWGRGHPASCDPPVSPG